jgi:bacterioferritin (cytochrome b1)
MAGTSTAALAPSSAADRQWIATELGKGIEAERALSAEAKARGESPPDPSLGVLYHEIAASDESHAAVIERVAVRYGHTPAASTNGGGIGGALGQIKDRFVNLGASPLDLVAADLQEKSRSIHWLTAWAGALEKIGDSASGQELTAVLKEEEAHHDALQQAFNWMIERHARGPDEHDAD